MCRICQGQPLNVKTFNEFKLNAFRAVNSYQDLSGFINQAKMVDKLRFDSSDEWGEPNILQSVSKLIFTNPNADEGLLLFTLGCWLDMQAKYTIVWTTYLRQAKNWLNDQGLLLVKDLNQLQSIFFKQELSFQNTATLVLGLLRK
jgi:hypothetical protein